MVTRSAHRSPSALRQGSYLHLIGADEVQERAAQELFQLHTTSPSRPAPAGLDLARAQVTSEGERLVQLAPPGRRSDLNASAAGPRTP
ncbi:hypothetical protein GCM10010381_54110 [Streptomyces xantholiticus]|nr:hypothetical protein GCM10010381_54110 [Streptomyces xantholiticus]